MKEEKILCKKPREYSILNVNDKKCDEHFLFISEPNHHQHGIWIRTRRRRRQRSGVGFKVDPVRRRQWWILRESKVMLHVEHHRATFLFMSVSQKYTRI